jgi:TonB family protein
MQGHFDEIRSCYQRAGKAQRYAAGKVTLRFLVSGAGQTDDVLVVESNLGNYGVERCLVEVGRRITFKAPEGKKATTFAPTPAAWAACKQACSARRSIPSNRELSPITRKTNRSPSQSRR